MQGERHNFDFKEVLAVCQAGNWQLWKRKYGQFAVFLRVDCVTKASFCCRLAGSVVDYAHDMAENRGRQFHA